MPNFFRASEIYVSGNGVINESILSKQLPEDNFRILGQNQRTLEFILQVKEFSPSKLRYYLRNLPDLFTGVEKVRLYPWSPNP